MAGCVDVRAYAELNDFVAAESRNLAVRRAFRPHQTVKDVIEAMGIPHTEIDLILVNGEPVDFAHRPREGDRIAVYPAFETLDIEPVARLRPAPPRVPRFVVDVNLGRLARLLRLLGFDVTWASDAEDQTLAVVSREQQRFLLTRDRGLLKRRMITHGLFVHADRPFDQTVEVVRRLDLGCQLAPFTRCLRCNGSLVAAPKAAVIDRLEPLTRRYYDEFGRCTGCGQIYWPGSHHPQLQSIVKAIGAEL
ncbi:Mut7-C RNAse domain-containing protein [Rhodococcus jostii]|uniref:Mut7-C RNAse domain-containing protein n=1 Tax=Rhodococcus jostii TaxID=132919 RepID=UPI0036495F95